MNITMTDEEMADAPLPDCIFVEDWCREHGRDTFFCYQEFGDRSIAKAARDKAVLGIVAWLDNAFAEATNKKGSIIDGHEVVTILTDLAIALRTEDIQKT